MKRIYDNNLENTYVEGQLKTLQASLDLTGEAILECNSTIDYGETLTIDLTALGFEFEVNDYIYYVSSTPYYTDTNFGHKFNHLCPDILCKVSESDSWLSDLGVLNINTCIGEAQVNTSGKTLTYKNLGVFIETVEEMSQTLNVKMCRKMYNG